MALFKILEKQHEVITKNITKTSYSKVIRTFGYDFLEKSFESHVENNSPTESTVGFVGNPPLKITYDE